MEGAGPSGIVVICLKDKEMDRVRKELEVLKSWGIESISVDKVLDMVKESEGGKDETAGEDCVRTVNPPREEKSGVDTLFNGIASATITAFPVGGTIFYIDNSVDGVYEFFDADGNRIRDVKIGDRPSYYRVVKKGPADKYYVYHDAVYDTLRWNYCKNGEDVYEALNTSDGIRTGKINTEVVMAKDNGAYITIDSEGYSTIWYQLQQVRDAKVGGCDDWFVPSKAEINLLEDAVESGAILGGTIARSSYAESIFKTKWIWSSSEHSSFVGKISSRNTWHWVRGSQIWSANDKHCVNSVFFIRAF